MKYALQVNGSPSQSQAGLTAYRFAEAALLQGHEIIRIFFYQEGIYQGLRSICPAEDELNMPALWTALAKQWNLDLVVCISAAQRRGLLHEDEAKANSKQDNDLADGFRLAGLGQWLEANLQADRVLVFA